MTVTFERLRRLAGMGASGDEGATDFVCRGCGAGHEVQYHSCPDCGSFAVESARYDGGVDEPEGDLAGEREDERERGDAGRT